MKIIAKLCKPQGAFPSRSDGWFPAAYGHATPSAPVEIVNLRATATGGLPHPKSREVSAQAKPVAEAIRQRRQVYFAENGCSVE